MKSNPNVLIFAPAFAPNFFSEAIVNSKLALALLRAGWDVTVFSAAPSPDFGYTNKWEEPWIALKESVKQFAPNLAKSRLKNLSGVCSAIMSGRHPIPSAQWALRVANEALTTHQKRPFDLMITRSTSCIAHLPGLIVKRRLNLPWIANWNDPPAHLFPAPYTHDTSPFRSFIYERYMRDAAANADVNTFPSKRLEEYLMKPLGLGPKNKTEVIPHVGLDWNTPIQKTQKQSLRICHAGNLSSERDPRGFLLAFSNVMKRNPSIKFEFDLVGKIPDEIRSEVCRLHLTKYVTYSEGLSFLDSLEHMAQADVLLLIEAPLENGIFFPSKIIDYCQVARPIFSVSPRFGVMQDLMKKYDIGYFAEVGDTKAIEASLDKIVSDWKANQAMVFGHQNLLRESSPKTVVEKIAQLVWP